MFSYPVQFSCRFLILLVVYPVSQLPAQVNHATVRKIASDVIKNREIGFIKPVVKVEEGAVFFDLPEPRFVIRLDNRIDDPLLNPIRNQLVLDLMRMYPPDNLSREVWKPYLDRVDQLIGQKVQIVTARNISQQQRDSQLFQLGNQIRDTYEKGKQAYAQKRGLQLGMRFPSRPFFKVGFTSNPGGARVWLVHALDNRVAQAQGKRPPWQLVQNPRDTRLEGKYFYLLQWGDRERVGEQPIIIDRNGTYALR